MKDISKIRQQYNKGQLGSNDLKVNPFDQFKSWLNEAVQSQCLEPTAMTLSTVSADGRPSSRIVLLKEVNDSSFNFFTNYNSQKGLNMNSNAYVALNFFWPELERQVRIEGRVEKLSASESDSYFKSRPRESQLGAWASSQSEIVHDDEELEVLYKTVEKKFEGQNVIRPSYWGGYAVHPTAIEFWQGRANRMHDRFSYKKCDESWLITRLAP